MFEDLRAAFREAVDNFQKELSRDQVGENVDRILKGMIDEVTDAKAHLAGLEDQLEKTGSRLSQETAAAATCRRREEMARKIDDGETARIAAEHAGRHEERAEVLDQRRQALAAEIALTRRDVEEMTGKLKEARASRASLEAEVGRTSARESLSETDRLFAEFDRFEDRVADEGARAGAAEDLYGDRLHGDARSEMHIDLDAPPPRREIDYDAALEELKRRMKDAE
ncbi:MAG: hypothetical protein RQ745_06135 [Longimicrobiales bacterium]|nr:hypothetical protein [Longimicrobiales bacterium]